MGLLHSFHIIDDILLGITLLLLDVFYLLRSLLLLLLLLLFIRILLR